jgi:hypothetical protein
MLNNVKALYGFCANTLTTWHHPTGPWSRSVRCDSNDDVAWWRKKLGGNHPGDHPGK